VRSLDLVVRKSTTRAGALSLSVLGREGEFANGIYDWVTKHCRPGEVLVLVPASEIIPWLAARENGGGE
jgi:hypothetical protein